MPRSRRSLKGFGISESSLTKLGYLTAVLINGATAQQNAKIDQIGLRGHLTAVITSEELGAAKPDPSFYLGACRQLQVEPHETLHVGDRYNLDVLSTRAANFKPRRPLLLSLAVPPAAAHVAGRPTRPGEPSVGC